MRALVYIFALLSVSCRYADFSPVEEKIEGRWTVNSSIAQLRQSPIPIAQPLTVEGIVVANDSTGNFYKQIIIVDCEQTASVAVRIGYYDSYAQFGKYQLVALRLDGLIVKQVDGLLTAGYLPNAPDTVPAAISTVGLVARHLHLQNQHVVLDDVARRFDELEPSDIGLPFLFTDVYMDDLLGSYAGERKLHRAVPDTTATLYTSPYATFAADAVPQSVFDLRAVVMSHQDELQLKIN